MDFDLGDFTGPVIQGKEPLLVRVYLDLQNIIILLIGILVISFLILGAKKVIK